MSEITVCALFYGDHPDLAARCLRSLEDRLPSPRVGGVRLGLNAVSAATRDEVDRFSGRCGTPVALDASDDNRLKYPVMRRLLAGVATELVMWFDDDSCLRPEAPADWFDRAAAVMADADVTGHGPWRARLAGAQHRWVEDQPWYGGKPVWRGRPVTFVNGGWWTARADVLRRYDYPFPALVHRGGDVMLGELCRQRGLRLRFWSDGVAGNADAALRNSRSPRRGHDERPVGFDHAP